MFDDYIQISKLNDFIFCPYSIYLHNVYENFHESTYHDTYQTAGKLVHEPIDNKTFSTEKDILQGISIYSDKYKLVGKLDIYNKKTKELIERKNKIKQIYDGYYLQLYAQYFSLIEMGYFVSKISLYSLSDNKKYSVPLPSIDDTERFEQLLEKIHTFDVKEFKGVSELKCQKCVYNVLCPYSKC